MPITAFCGENAPFGWENTPFGGENMPLSGEQSTSGRRLDLMLYSIN
jgi:hypothetical protein